MITLTASDAQRLGIVGLGHKRDTKYGNQHVRVDGYTFKSQVEAAHYSELVLRQKAGQIVGLRVHPRYVIVPKDDNGPSMCYEADFEYVTLPDMERVVEDVKSAATANIPLFRLKWRLAQVRYPYTFKVVMR